MPNEQINRLAAGLDGVCVDHKWTFTKTRMATHCKKCKRAKYEPEQTIDYCNDANAAKSVAGKVDVGLLEVALIKLWVKDDAPKTTVWAALLPAKTLTLAALVAAGLIEIEDAKEGMMNQTKTCNTCFHSDNAHNDGSGRLEVCFVCAAENENPKTVCTKFNDSGCNFCPFCGSGSVIIEAPSAAGGSRVVYDAFCINEECGARIEGCATKGTARYLWNSRAAIAVVDESKGD